MGGAPLAEDFEPDVVRPVLPNWKQWIVKNSFVYLQTDKPCLRDLYRANYFASGKPRRLSGTSAREGERTYNCLIGQYLGTNGLFGTFIDVAASYVFG